MELEFRNFQIRVSRPGSHVSRAKVTQIWRRVRHLGVKTIITLINSEFASGGLVNRPGLGTS